MPQDTQQAIQSLQTFSASERNEAAGHLAKADSADLSVLQLQGVLVTQSNDLKAQFQGTIDTLTQQNQVLSLQIPLKDQTIADLNNQVLVLQQQVVDLQNVVSNPVVPANP